MIGLENGEASDYNQPSLSACGSSLARVKAQLRRVRLDREDAAATSTVQPDVVAEQMVFDDLVINLGRREVTARGEVFHLKPKEFDLLVYLARNRGMVLTRDVKLLERVWGWEYDGGSRTVDVHVRWLREKATEQDPSAPTRLLTVRSIGYRFKGETAPAT